MPYVVHAADLKGSDGDIVRLWQGSLDAGTSDHYAWVHDGNPNGKVACWVVTEAERTEAVGTLSVFPRTLSGRAGEWHAGVTGDFAVSTRHRALGPALMLQRAAVDACRRGRFDFLYGFPSPNSLGVQLRAGFSTLGNAIELRRWIRSRVPLERRYGAAGAAAAVIVDAALKTTEYAWRAVYGRGVTFREVTAFDARFDDFWDRVRRRHAVTGERTAAYLNWRFARCPDRRYTALALERAPATIAGYAVWSIRGDTAMIADLVTENTARDAVPLVAEVLRRLRDKGVAAVQMRYFGSADLPRALRILGFRAHRSTRSVVMWAAPDAPRASTLRDPQQWYLLEGDADL